MKYDKTLLSFLVLLFFLFFISGCGEKAQCESSLDCLDKTCFSVKCTKEKCVYTAKKNCCGNEKKDELEDGKKGSWCSCPTDYEDDVCEGKVKYMRGERSYDYKYLERFCNENKECITGINPNEVKPIQLMDERSTSFFRIETVASFSQPFDLLKDVISIRITLKDTGADLVLPITITKVSILQNNILFGEMSTAENLEEVGDEVVISVPLTYVPQQPEEEKSLSYKLDYEYTKVSHTSKGDRNELVRESYSKGLSTPVALIRSEENE